MYLILVDMSDTTKWFYMKMKQTVVKFYVISDVASCMNSIGLDSDCYTPQSIVFSLDIVFLPHSKRSFLCESHVILNHDTVSLLVEYVFRASFMHGLNNIQTFDDTKSSEETGISAIYWEIHIQHYHE
jgi:hypothetical protein